MRRNGVTGRVLLKALSETYHAHGMQEHAFVDRQSLRPSATRSRIICSEALV